MANQARLRTKSGCLTCRQRKKKCDETRPKCLRCQPPYECRWPTERDNARDRRLRKSRTTILAPNENSNEVSSTGIPAILRVAEVLPRNVNVEMAQESVLLAYFANHMLSSLIHKRSHARYVDVSYLCSLISKYQPLKDTVLACASMVMSWKYSNDYNWHLKMGYKAYWHHRSALVALQDLVQTGALDGTEDWLLITANQLTMFDTQDHEIYGSTVSLHVDAVMNLVKCRERAKKMVGYQPKPPGSMGLERICYEALLYHGGTRMAIDRNFDLIERDWNVICEYFGSAQPMETGKYEEDWPVIGIPFGLYRLAVVASRLSRKKEPAANDLQLARTSLAELSAWYPSIEETEKFTTAYLYLVAINALLQGSLACGPVGQPVFATTHDVSKELATVTSILDHGPINVRYALWPLCTLYRICSGETQKQILKVKIALSLQNLDHTTVRSLSQNSLRLFLAAPGLLSDPRVKYTSMQSSRVRERVQGLHQIALRGGPSEQHESAFRRGC